jgi:hypothetical protein
MNVSLVQVTPDDVKDKMKDLFGVYEIPYRDKRFQPIAGNISMYPMWFPSPLNGEKIGDEEIRNHSCYMSVKVPNDLDKAGQSIHLSVRYEFADGSDMIQIYPKKRQGALGRYHIKSIKLTENWANELEKEAKKGIHACLFDGSTTRRIRRILKLRMGIDELPHIRDPVIEVVDQTPASLYPNDLIKWQNGESGCYDRENWQRQKGTCLKIKGTTIDDETLWSDIYIGIPTRILEDKKIDNKDMVMSYDRSDVCDDNKHIWMGQLGVCIRNLNGKEIKIKGIDCEPKKSRIDKYYYNCKPDSDSDISFEIYD